MRVVHRFVLTGPVSDIRMPRGAVPTTAGLRGSEMCVWAIVDPGAPVESRRFFTILTGAPIPAEAGALVATVALHDPGSGAAYVQHVFDSRPEPSFHGDCV